jgi:hypothetical protein
MGDFFAGLPGNEDSKMRTRSLGPQGVYLDYHEDYCSGWFSDCTCDGLIFYSTWDAMMNDEDNQRFSSYRTNGTETVYCLDHSEDVFYDSVPG